MTADVIARSIDEVMGAEIYRVRPPLCPDDLLLVTVTTTRAGEGGYHLRLTLDEVSGCRGLWSRSSTTAKGDISEDITGLALVNGLIGALLERNWSLPAPEAQDPDAALDGMLALRDLFSIEAPRIAFAETRLLRAFERDPRGEYQGWLAQLYAIQYVERFVPLEDLVGKASEACTRAIAMNPFNSHVLASVANARLVLEKQIVTCGELARMSVTANPANPLAWWALSAAKTYYGSYEDAYRAASRADSLSQGTRFAFWTGFQQAVSALMTERLSEAVRLSEVSIALAPNFRPPLRYATAAYASLGLEGAAQDKARRLSELEPNFSIERLASDRAYPASLLHVSKAVDLQALRRLE